jgi:hypothetical protein
MLSGRGFCNGPIPPPEEFYRLWCDEMNMIRKTSTWEVLGPRRLFSYEERFGTE